MQEYSYSFVEHFSDPGVFGLDQSEFWKDAHRIANELTIAANRGDELSTYWIDRLIREGVSDVLLRDASKRVGDVHVRSNLELDIDNRRFDWVSGPQRFDETPGADRVCALMVVHLISSGLVEKLKLCEFDECGNFFLGNKKARYCNDKCGSIVRARQWRMRRREGQMMR